MGAEAASEWTGDGWKRDRVDTTRRHDRGRTWTTAKGFDVAVARDDRSEILDLRQGWPSIITATAKAFEATRTRVPTGSPAPALEPWVHRALDAMIPFVFGRSVPGYGLDGRCRDEQRSLLLAGPFAAGRRCGPDSHKPRLLLLQVDEPDGAGLVVESARLLRTRTSCVLLGWASEEAFGRWEGFAWE